MGIKIGITGGIGSGKTLVCNIFKVLGVPVYNADDEAKLIMIKDAEVISALKREFGDAVYHDDGSLNRSHLSNIVFDDQEKLTLLNSIVHPAVIKAGEKWAENQTTAYNIKEAALLFESGSYKKLDYTILVTAPQDIRVQRVKQRDGVPEEQVLARINKQWSDEKKKELADFIIINDGKESLIKQVLVLHNNMNGSLR